VKLAGRFAVYLGIILIVLGMITGFGAMIANQDSATLLRVFSRAKAAREPIQR